MTYHPRREHLLQRQHRKTGRWPTDWPPLRPSANTVVTGPVRLSPFKTFNVRQRGDAEGVNWCWVRERHRETGRRQEAQKLTLQEPWGGQGKWGSWSAVREEWRNKRRAGSAWRNWATNLATDKDGSGALNWYWITRATWYLEMTWVTFSWSQRCSYGDGFLSPLGFHVSLKSTPIRRGVPIIFFHLAPWKDLTSPGIPILASPPCSPSSQMPLPTPATFVPRPLLSTPSCWWEVRNHPTHTAAVTSWQRWL